MRYEYQCEYTSGKRASNVHALNGDNPPELTHQPSWPDKEVVQDSKPSVIQLQKHPLTAPGARFHHRGILDPVKTRFVRANSAIAFPRILGMDMESEAIPRLHSFAWNLGIRSEEQDPLVDVRALVPWPEMQRYSTVYFAIVKPELGLLDEAEFNEKAATRFTNTQGYHEMDPILLLVTALGSFFSPNPHPREAELVRATKQLLTERRWSVNPSPNTTAAWILMTIYMRCVGRPHGSWLSSSIAMHQAEASGLHKEMQTIAVVYPAVTAADHKLVKTRRKLFWIARALNIILSFEYGRSRINFDVITTKKFTSDNGSHAHQFVELAELLPSDFVDREREPDPPAALGNALTNIEEMQTDSAFMTLLKADLAFAIYRRLWLMSLTDAKDRAETVLSLGRTALKASSALLESKIPWWNVLHVPFQFICVSLAVSTPKSYAQVGEAMALLKRIADKYPTHMVHEAYNQANAMVRMSRLRKEKELDALRALPEGPPFEDHPSISSTSGMTEAPNVDWNMDFPFEWDMFLNPNLVISSQQGQLGDPAFATNLGF